MLNLLEIFKMDLQIRKIHFVQEFLRVNNEQIIDKIENMLKSEKSNFYDKMPAAMSMDEYNSVIDSAEDDSKNNRMKNVQELKKDIKSWI